MHRIFQRFIDLLSEAHDRDALSEAMAVTAAALDLSCFAYLALPQRSNNDPLIISTYPPHWVSHYMGRRYERIDPVILQALESPEPFRWGPGIFKANLSVAQHELFDEALEFGIQSGFTVPIHDGHGPIAALTFASGEPCLALGRYIASQDRVLQLMAMYFHAHVRRRLQINDGIEGILLSPRELECLKWASEGKSAWEIGRIVGISRNTAAFYLGNAKKKLGVRTVVQAATRLAAANKGKQN